jgi:hypothetical protein
MGRRDLCLAVSVVVGRVPLLCRPGDLAALNAMLANLGSGRPNRAQRRAQNFCQKLEVK